MLSLLNAVADAIGYQFDKYAAAGGWLAAMSCPHARGVSTVAMDGGTFCTLIRANAPPPDACADH